MGITYGASPGTIITSAIVYETLGSQTGASANSVILATANVTPSTHANYGGQVGTGAAGNGPGNVYTGRLVAVRVGTATEEIKIVTSVTDLGSTIELFVHENWTTQPASSDVLYVAYTMDDIENGGAGGGVSYTSKTKEFAFTNKLTVGNGTAFAMLQLGAAESMEINDSAGATDPDLEVKNNAMFCSGYLYGGRSTNGGYISSAQNADGEETFNVESGGYLRFHDTNFKISLNDLKIDLASGCDAQIKDMKNYQFTYNCNLLDGSYEDIKWVGGSGTTNDYVRISSATYIKTWLLISTAGFNTASGSTSTESLTIRDVVFINNSRLITVNSNKSWYVINPTWTATTYSNFSWDTSTANYIYDQRSIDVVVQEVDGTALQNANVLVYENTQLNDLVMETYTNSSGVAAGVFTYKKHSTNSSTLTYGGHALRVDRWLYTPFAATQASNEAFDAPVVLIDDPNILTTTQATALSNGSGITWNKDTNASSIIEFTGGTGTLSVGNTVTGGTSTADGIVTQFLEGNSTAGIIHLKTRDANNFSGTESLSNGSGWSATLVSGSQQNFSIWIDADGKDLQVVYDYLAALTAETTLSATGEYIHEWGRDSRVRAVFSTGSSFYTLRSYTQGVIVIDYGAGTLDYFTDNAGGTYTPPTTLTITITVQDRNTDPVVGAQVGVFTIADRTELMNEDTIESGGLAVASQSYTGAVPVDIEVRVRKASSGATKYKNFSTLGTITGDFSLLVTLEEDPYNAA